MAARRGRRPRRPGAPLEGSSRRQAGEGWPQKHGPLPTTPQSPAVTPLTRPGPSVAARHLPTLWGVTPQGEPFTLPHAEASHKKKPCRKVGRAV